MIAIGRSIAAVSALLLVVACHKSATSDALSGVEDRYAAIQSEIARSSSIDATLGQLADVYGPRLTGTPRYLQMVQWVESQLRDWGVDDIQVEGYADGDRGWEVASFSAAMTTPTFASLDAQPVCCSRGTVGTAMGMPLVVDFYDIEALQEYTGKLDGRILLHPDVTELMQAESGRWSDERLAAAANRKEAVTPDGLDGPGSDVTYVEQLRKRDAAGDEADRAIAEFLLEQGVAAVLRSSSAPAGIVNNRFDTGLVQFHGVGDPKPVPFFVIPREQHSRLLALIASGAEPELSLQLETRFYEEPYYHVNLIAEIPGSDPKLKDQVVMLGAHLDSVETATGAADNGIGSATSMEVLRVIKALGLSPRRTIRVALWGGEEQGLKGSSAYVRKYIGDIMTGEYLDGREQISAYFNHDNNGHDIRGIFTVGNRGVQEIFKPLFETFSDVGGNTVTIENACCTDIVVFDAAGIPSFEWIHDPGPYFTHQLHTNLDVPALVSIESANRNAAIIATAVFETAMLDERLPRRDRP